MTPSANDLKHGTPNPLQRALMDRFHGRVVRQLRGLGPTTLLDAGCGEGYVSQILLDALPGVQLTGFDHSEYSVGEAVTRNPEGTFLTADITALPFEDDSFDVVCCLEVLEHLHEPDRALRELVRVARRGLVLTVPQEPIFCLANAARGKNLRVRPPGSDPDHRQFWTRRSFGRFVSTAAQVTAVRSCAPWTICEARPA